MNRILTPFSRTENLVELGNSIKETGAHWHLLSVEGEFKLPPLGTWVTQHFFKPPAEGHFIGHHLCNEFIELGLEPEDRYMTLTDDDGLEPGFFKNLEPYPDDIIVVSMQRSNVPTVGDGGGPFDTLVAHPRNMKVGSCGLEQIVIKGKVLQNYRLGARYEADGDLIEKLWAERQSSIRFVPDVKVYFDRLPPGAWKCNRWNR